MQLSIDEYRRWVPEVEMKNNLMEEKSRPLIILQKELETAQAETHIMQELNSTLKSESGVLAEQLILLKQEKR